MGPLDHLVGGNNSEGSASPLAQSEAKIIERDVVEPKVGEIETAQSDCIIIDKNPNQVESATISKDNIHKDKNNDIVRPVSGDPVLAEAIGEVDNNGEERIGVSDHEVHAGARTTPMISESSNLENSASSSGKYSNDGNRSRHGRIRRQPDRYKP